MDGLIPINIGAGREFQLSVKQSDDSDMTWDNGNSFDVLLSGILSMDSKDEKFMTKLNGKGMIYGTALGDHSTRRNIENTAPFRSSFSKGELMNRLSLFVKGEISLGTSLVVKTESPFRPPLLKGDIGGFGISIGKNGFMEEGSKFLNNPIENTFSDSKAKNENLQSLMTDMANGNPKGKGNFHVMSFENKILQSEISIDTTGETKSQLETALMKEALMRNESSPLSKHISAEQRIRQEQHKKLSLNELTMKPQNIFFSEENSRGPTNFTGIQRMVDQPEIIQTKENGFMITRKDNTSIEVALEPDGLGKLDIEVHMEKGLINAQVNASEITGKELIEKNLTSILNTLAEDGIQIGSFSVFLKDKGDEMGDHRGEGGLKKTETTEKINLSISYSNNGRISIFV